MAGIQVTTAPTAQALSLQEVKEYLRLDDSADERIVRPFIEAVTNIAEEHMNRALMSQTFTMFLDGFNESYDPLWEGTRTGIDMNFYRNHLPLPKPPVTSVTSVSTFNDADTETTFAASKYYVDTVREPARVVLRTGEVWPTALRVANAIKVVYGAGYTNAYSVPEPIRMGMLQHIAYLYEHRGDMYEAVAPMPPMVKRLYQPYVVHSGFGTATLLAAG